MSYLNVPRLHFHGEFITDPSTINNLPDNYDLDNPNTFQDDLWNPDGTGAWSLSNCSVTAVTYENGGYVKAPGDDPVLGAPFQSVQTNPFGGKLVDLDPEQQLVSEIWGLRVMLGASDNQNSFWGDFQPAAFQDIWWQSGPGGQAGARVYYQSVITDVQWSSQIDSKWLQKLKEVSSDALSIKFMLDRYNAHNPELGDQIPPNFPDPQNNLPFTHGRIVGTIGPYLTDEPKHFVIGRLLRPTSAHMGMHYASCIVDKPRKRVVLDLGNSLKAAHLIDETMQDYGPLVLAVLRKDDHKCLFSLGQISYQAKDWYHTTAGIQEFPIDQLTAEQLDQLKHNPLGVIPDPRAPTPKGLDPNQPFLQENPDGSYVRADQFVYRLNTTDKHKQVDLYATQYGKPIPGAKIKWFHQKNQDATGTGPPEALPLPELPPTDAGGKVSYVWKATDPGNRQRQTQAGDPYTLDGQLYYVTYQLEGFEDTYPNTSSCMTCISSRKCTVGSGCISLQLYGAYPDVQSPTWWGHVHDILAQYSKLYPVMGFIKLNDYHSIVSNWQSIKSIMNLDITDPMFMPVTRDLSASKLALINKWFDNGMPEGTSPE